MDLSLGLGTAPIGGLFTSVSEVQAAATLEAAWDLGIRFYDTAPLYGLGASEVRLGRMLVDKPRDEYVISTKVGRLIRSAEEHEASHDISAWVDRGDRVSVFDFSYDGVLRSLDESLERLGLDRVDIVLIHDPDDYFDDAAGAYRALARLREQGVIGEVGAGMNQWEMLLLFMQIGDFDRFLLAGRYTLLDRSGEAFLDTCSERGIGVLAGGVFNSGLLAGGSTFDYTKAPPALVERTRDLERRCAEAGVPLKAAALQFPLLHPAVTTVLTGARTPVEIAENIAMFTTDISEETWSQLLRV